MFQALELHFYQFKNTDDHDFFHSIYWYFKEAILLNTTHPHLFCVGDRNSIFPA